MQAERRVVLQAVGDSLTIVVGSQTKLASLVTGHGLEMGPAVRTDTEVVAAGADVGMAEVSVVETAKAQADCTVLAGNLAQYIGQAG